MGAAKNRADDFTSDACVSCNQGYTCGVLKTALVILDEQLKSSEDKNCKQRYEDFQEKLRTYGYQFPDGLNKCWLSDKREVIEGLIDEARVLLDSAKSK